MSKVTCDVCKEKKLKKGEYHEVELYGHKVDLCLNCCDIYDKEQHLLDKLEKQLEQESHERDVQYRAMQQQPQQQQQQQFAPVVQNRNYEHPQQQQAWQQPPIGERITTQEVMRGVPGSTIRRRPGYRNADGEKFETY